MENERFLVTGAAGCIGAWTLARLASEGVETFALDLSGDNRRLSLVSGSDESDGIHRIVGDIRDLETVESSISPPCRYRSARQIRWRVPRST